MIDFPFGLAAGIWTGLSMILFIGVMIWAYSKNNQSRFDEAARLAVDELPPQDNSKVKSTDPQEYIV